MKKRKEYNKLVRSEIPTIIKESGKSCSYAKLFLEDSEDEIIRLLKDKLVEEAIEVSEAIHKGDVLEEMGDLYETWKELSFIIDRMDGINTILKGKKIQKGKLNLFVDDKGFPARDGFGGRSQFTKLIVVEEDE